MPVACALSVALVGLDGHLVEVEADLARGLPALALIGLPDATVNEARDRVRAAVINSGEVWPQSRITVGLSPAALPKRGSAFDFAMAVAILAAAGTVPSASLAGLVLLGELGLDGRARHVVGLLPAVLAAVRAGIERVVVPAANAAEAALVPGVGVVPVPGLRELLALLRGEPVELPPPATGGPSPAAADAPLPDLADVRGQPEARHMLEVAAAGGHHVCLLGPPGAGKTMLAERLPSLLPPLGATASLEVSAIHSLAGVLPQGSPLVTRPPFRNPHHSASVSALVGGGSGIARPGEVSLAHRGVLFLDEAPEFSRGVLDSLRQPLESGVVTIARAGGTARYPARCSLILAANPCPCAAGGRDQRHCTCPPQLRRRYLARLSGPLLDRVDIRLSIRAVTRAALVDDQPAEGSATVAARVAVARDRAVSRFAGLPWRTNADVPAQELRVRWPLPRGALAPAYAALDTGALSARGLDRVVRLAWTLADLEARDRPGPDEVATALRLRADVT